MENESLSKQSLEKLKSMPRAVKIKLFHRLRIIELNKVIGPILANTVGNDNVRKTKAKIIHQLYDENFKKDVKYSELQAVLESGVNFYDQLDGYTTAAYANYYALFVKHAKNARNSFGIDSAMDKALHEVRSCVQTEDLRLVASKKNAIPSSLLQAKYRKAVIAYLEEELKTKFSTRQSIVVDGLDSDWEEEYASLIPEMTKRSRSLRSTRDLERYSMNGEVFYLDADGEFYLPDQVNEEWDG